MKKVIAIAALTLLAQHSFATDLSSVGSLTCTGSNQTTSTYDQSSQTLEITKNGETKSYQMTKASGGSDDIDVVLNGSSDTNGMVQMNISSKGTIMIYQVSSGEVDYLSCTAL